MADLLVIGEAILDGVYAPQWADWPQNERAAFHMGRIVGGLEAGGILRGTALDRQAPAEDFRRFCAEVAGAIRRDAAAG